jgi:hypothetical protein
MKRLLVPVCAALVVGGFAFLTNRASAARFAAPAPSIQIVSPTRAVTVPVNGKIPITVRVTGVKMDPKDMGRKNIPGAGHYHFYIDCIPPDAYQKADLSGCWAAATTATSTVFDLARSQVRVTQGTHVLLVALAQNDHVLYKVPPSAMIFTVTSAPVSIRIVSPKGPVTVAPNGSIPITVNVTGVTLAPNMLGRSNVPGYGHYHFYVDCIPPDAYVRADLSHCWAAATAATSTVFRLASSHVKITKGTHLLLVALAQNDHVLYRAPAADIVFTVR